MSRSGELPARRGNGVGRGGPARGYSWPPFEKGHTVSLKHGLDGRLFRPLDRVEIAEVADGLREVCPAQIRQPAFEPLLQLLAARIWRLRRAYAYLEGVPEDQLPRHFSEKLGSLELLVNKTLVQLGLTPVSASELGINLARLAAVGESGPAFDWSALEERERKQLERLLKKGRGEGGD